MRTWNHGGGFSVDAAVRIAGSDRRGLERLLRYCARPPFALERIDLPLMEPALDDSSCEPPVDPEPDYEYDQRITW